MFSRSQFELACKAFSQRHACWSWCDNPRAGYGYLTRTTTHARNVISDLEGDLFIVDNHGLDIDDLATAQPSPLTVAVNEYIAYAASFNVPAFYFTIHDSNGLPLPLADLVQTSLFKVKPPDGSDKTTFALTLPSTPFPLLSQGDHPTLGTPCWYFHPCQTDVAVGEFMSEAEEPNWTEEARYVRWLELWLMIVGSVVNL
ncbi:hypothetical protein BYT27DRAFT_7182808 [Phlegmacium glaucopus]|nr:hypothetical protein BYT27DRAFT_7182808 [Phlegmacium glaucopus]